MTAGNTTTVQIKSNYLHLLITAVLCIVLSFSLCSTSVYADEPDVNTVPVGSPNVTVYCTDTGSFLYSKNADSQIYPASTTKILTAIVALENADLEQEVEISMNAVYGIDPSSSHIALDEYEHVKMKDLLYGLLLASGNDCAVAIAEAVGGSVEGFSDMMNAKAEEIGCTDSHFSNPHGLFSEDHYTTVHDLSLIMAYAIQNETFVEIASTVTYTIPKTDKHEPRELWNGHGMLKGKYAYYEPVVCGKTGYITEAGFNLVTYGTKNGIHLIVAVAGADQQSQDCADTKALMEFYFNNYTLSAISVPEDASDEIRLDEETVIPTKVEAMDLSFLVPAGTEAEPVSFETVPKEGLARPIMKGDQVGDLNVIQGDAVVATVPVLSAEEFQVPGHALKGLDRSVLIAAAGVITLLIILLLIMMIRKRRRHRNKYHFR